MSTTPSQVEPSGTPVAGSGVAAAPSRSPVLSRPRPTPKPRIELCPYCGRESVNTTRCSTCGGQFDALSKQATQNAMGPWWLREGEKPLRPGCSYDTIKGMVGRGTITAETVLRGPTTRQFWTRARRVPGVAHLLGMCHSCQREVAPDAFMCAACGASFVTETDRQHLGLSPVALLPGQAAAERIAAVSAASLPVPMREVPAESTLPAMPPSPVSGSIGSPISSPAGTKGFGPVSAAVMGGGIRATNQPTASTSAWMNQLPVETVVKYVKRPRSMVGTLAIMLFGGMMAVGGVWVALLAAQGSASKALLAIGIDAGVNEPTVMANRQENRATPTDAGRIPVDAQNPTGSSTPIDPGPEATGVGRGEQVASVPASNGSGSNQSQTPTVESPGVEPATTSVLAELIGHVQAGGAARLAQASALVDQAERERRITGDEASAWRIALEAREQRAAMGGLP